MLPALLVAPVLVAGSCAAWHGQVVGQYPGVVESQGPKRIDTWITLDPDDRLSGRYMLHEPTRDVPGTLQAVGDDGCDAALFRWTDLYGTGLVRLQFQPADHCFDGAWGLTQLNPALEWHTCFRAPVTS
jgi:hypothetical protein